MRKSQKNKVKVGDVDAIRTRLRWWYEKRKSELPERYGNYDRAARTLGMNRPTLRGWLAPTRSRRKPPLPNLRALVELIGKEGLNPTWLLLGSGPEFVNSDVQHADLGEHLRAFLVDEVCRSWGVGREFVEKLVPSPDELLAFTSLRFRKRIAGFVLMYMQSEAEGKEAFAKRLDAKPWSLASIPATRNEVSRGEGYLG